MTYHIKLTHDRGDVEQVDMRTEQGRCWHCGARAVFPVDEDRQPYCSMCARPQIRPVPMVTRSRERLPIAAMETGGDE